VPVLKNFAMKRVLNNPFIPQIRCTKGWPENFGLPALVLFLLVPTLCVGMPASTLCVTLWKKTPPNKKRLNVDG